MAKMKNQSSSNMYAGRFQRHDIGFRLSQPADQAIHADMVVTDEEAPPDWQHMHIQPILGNIDTDNHIHLIPSLPKRASHMRAALATVRVRWNGGW